MVDNNQFHLSPYPSPKHQDKSGNEISVIPKPQKVDLGGDMLTLPHSIFVAGSSTIVATAIASLNQRELDAQLAPDDVSAMVHFLHPDDGAMGIVELPTNPPGAYYLSVSEEGVIITADSERGWFHGLQSLLQLIDTTPRTGSRAVLPTVTITDWPRFKWRGYMLDESRHFSGIEATKRLLDTMAYYKLNIFHWHLTDSPGWRIEIKSKPKLTSVGSVGNYSDPGASPKFYTQEQIRDVVSFANARHIEVIPEIGMPGHMSAAMRSYPEFSGGGTEKDPYYTINPISDAADKFLISILDEVAELFIGAEVIHFGGDEVNVAHKSWRTLGGVQKLIEDGSFKSEHEIEAAFNRRIAKLINGLGFTVGGWDEVFGSGLEIEGTLIFWWHHDRPELLTEILESGYKVVLCPRKPQYFDFLQHETHNVGRTWDGFISLEDVYCFPDSLEAYENRPTNGKVVGINANLWTEQAITQERRDFLTFPRLLATAESAWTLKEYKIWETFFNSRLKNHLPLLETRGLIIFNPYSISVEIPR